MVLNQLLLLLQLQVLLLAAKRFSNSVRVASRCPGARVPASISARITTGIPFSRAARISGFPSAMADEAIIVKGNGTIFLVLALITVAVLLWVAFMWASDIDPEHVLPSTILRLNNPIVGGLIIAALMSAVIMSLVVALKSRIAFGSAGPETMAGVVLFLLTLGTLGLAVAIPRTYYRVLTAAKLYELPRKKARTEEVRLVRERMLKRWAADPRSEVAPEE